MLSLAGQPNHLSPVDILLRNMERQQIQTAIDTQYAKLAAQMKQEAFEAITKKNNTLREPPPTLKQLVNQGLATVEKPKNKIPKGYLDKSKIPKVSNKKGRKKLKDEITASQYFKLSPEEQLNYDRKMATEYDRLGLGPYRSLSFTRQKPINKKKPKIIRNTTKPNFFKSAY